MGYPQVWTGWSVETHGQCNPQIWVLQSGDTSTCHRYLPYKSISRSCSAEEPYGDLEFNLSSTLMRTKTINHQECNMNAHTNHPIADNTNPQNQPANASLTNLFHHLRLRFPGRLSPSWLEVMTDSAQSSVVLLSICISATCFIQHLTYLVDTNLLHCSLVHW